jgi:hypothetical protein
LICSLPRQEQRLTLAWGNSTTWVLAQRHPTNHQQVYRLVSSRSLAATHPFPEILLICSLPRQEQRLTFAWGNSTTWVLAQRHPTNQQQVFLPLRLIFLLALPCSTFPLL